MTASARTTDPVLLVAAKAPVPGYAKTRLAQDLGEYAAADVAAAALLDTLEVVGQLDAASVIALAGDLVGAARRDEVEEALTHHVRIDQRGTGLGERLANAHVDAAKLTGAGAVVQIGMDTPQVTTDLLSGAIAALDDADAALGAATDGGWWCLVANDPTLAQCLVSVPMSRADTGRLTGAALKRAGAAVAWLPELRDVDTLPDALEVAKLVPGSRFAAAVSTHAGLLGGSRR